MRDIAFYVGDEYPLTTTVYAEDGVTFATPDSATIDIVNQLTGAIVVNNDTCEVGTGYATYRLEGDSTVATTAGRYVAYIRVVFDNTNARTIAMYFDVLAKAAYPAVDQWIELVRDSAPNDDYVSDTYGRDYIDQAASYLNRNYGIEYSSTLGVITPAPNAGDLDLIARTAALMARTAWWAGKGNWRDQEMSFDGTPFYQEWNRLESKLTNTTSGWFSEDVSPYGYDMYNRDKTNRWGIPDEPDDYFDQEWNRDSQPTL